MERILGVTKECYNDEYICGLKQLQCDIACEELMSLQVACIEDFNLHIKSLQTGEILLEEVTVNNKPMQNTATTRVGKAVQGAKNVVTKIYNFIKKIVMAFVNKVKDLIQSNADWMKNNAYKLDSIEADFWDNCNITSYKYFDGIGIGTGNSYSEFKSFFKNTTGMYRQTGANKKNMTLADIQKSAPFKKYSDLQPDNFNEALKIAFRGGARELFSYQGNDAKTLCMNMRKFASEYSAISAKIKNHESYLKRYFDQYEKEVAALESFGVTAYGLIDPNYEGLYSVLEDVCVYDEQSDLAGLPIVDSNHEVLIVAHEAVKPAGNTAGNATTNAGANTNQARPTNQAGANNQGKANNPNRTAPDAFVRYMGQIASQVLACILTIAEECYNSSIKTLKDVVRAAEQRGNLKTNKQVNPASAKSAVNKQYTEKNYGEMSDTAAPKGKK